MSQGGPVFIDNFLHAYQHGGIIPNRGAEIVVTNESAPPSLSSFITSDLSGATILSSSQQTVAGNPATRVIYIDHYGPVKYSNVAIYIVHSGTLYKAYLSYNMGDPLEQNFLTDYQGMIDSMQLTQ